MKRSNKRGFTLVELVIVIAVIAILAGVMIATFAGVVNDAKESAKLQEAAQAEQNQKIADITAKLENADWLGWEDLENAIAEAMADVNVTVEGGMDVAQVEAAVTTAITEYMKANTRGDTGLTEEQMVTILNRALEGQLTTAQVETIVKKYAANNLTAAQISSIVNAAVANNATASQIYDLVNNVSDLENAIAKLSSNTTTTNNKVESLEDLIATYVAANTTTVTTVDEVTALLESRAPVNVTLKVEDDLTLAESQQITIYDGQMVTLDLTGVNLSVAAADAAANEDGSAEVTTTPVAVIVNNGYLTIKGGNITVPAIFVDNYGTLVLEDTTIKSTVNYSGVLINYATGTMTLNNVTVDAERRAVYNAGGVLEINGGTYSNKTNVTDDGDNTNGPWGYSYCISSYKTDGANPYTVLNNVTVKGAHGGVGASGGHTVINGGNYSSTGTSSHYALYIAGESGVASATVNAGTFTADRLSAVLVGNSGDGGIKENASVIIKGGKFIGTTTAIGFDGTLATASIQGGSFYKGENPEQINANYIANGYECVNGIVSKK